ncbi:tail protein [Variovorax phage VarioGold]|uniref:phage tail protein n=1 Tax=Variovorax sp. ZS18.2.2 TaxID=2971255 RepID=UPI002150C2E0|nr:phage tail protein [Variovorax sp. ZS18.2.2]MCR6477526.1 phage tail protein [Variovorax sp. ZS18.2.2]UYD72059.1 tail protein [Variovorax phage VarioGold]
MVQLPNGAKVALSSIFGAVKELTALSNANPAVASCVGHGFTDGKIILLESGWEELEGRAARVDDAAADNFELEGIDTSDLIRFPTSLGLGTAKEVTTWVAIDQIIGTAFAGGEQQYWGFSPLDSRRTKQIPTERSAQTATLTLADDDKKPWFAALDQADRLGDTRVLRITLPNGAILLYSGTVSFNKVPTLTKNEGMAVTMTLSINADITRYTA